MIQKLVATSVGYLIVFIAAWIIIFQSGQHAFALPYAGVVILACCIFDVAARRRDESTLLSIQTPREILLLIALTPALPLLFLVTDAVIAGVDLFDLTQWPKLREAKGPFGFWFTCMIAAGMISFTIVTLIRFLAFKIHAVWIARTPAPPPED